jgi:PIF1-like helicase/Helix-turn-helix domain/Helicase
MLQTDSSNTIFQLAANMVNNTARSVFLTGKAGTGKTTFLKYIKENTTKSTVVVAPTGVAAINAGGVTMHSFFQLPFGPFIPGTKQGFSDEEVADKHSLLKNLRINADKRTIFQELELLVIDEVSMVRCDMLDAIDLILRHFRRRYTEPFGGVQVLFIGDLFQLPPVIPSQEWNILQSYYRGPFFFDSKVLAEAPPLYIELKKIYRQNEQHFIDLLNDVRNNEVSKAGFELLHTRYLPGFTPPDNEQFITLTTHNAKADAMNAEALEQLPGEAHIFKAVLEGDFAEKNLPTERELKLKEGAQVMFVKNDSGSEKRYFNGKIATVKRIEKGTITVSMNPEGGQEMVLNKETWRNIRYTFNKEEQSIEEEEIGSFTQYPVRLAWSITIHKSQGLTFEKAIIDAGAAFAAGQVYVALSRCVSLQGLVLYSKIYPASITTDQRVVDFAEKEIEAGLLEAVLETERRHFMGALLLKQFNWTPLQEAMEQWANNLPIKKLPDPAGAVALTAALQEQAGEQAAVAEKFRRQLSVLLKEAVQTNNPAMVVERASRAISYFSNLLVQDILKPLQQHIASLQNRPSTGRYLSELKNVEAAVWNLLQKLLNAHYGDLVLNTENIQYDDFRPLVNEPIIHVKQQKGSSQRESLTLFRSGKSISDIAAIRLLTPGTVYAHLCSFIQTGEIDIGEMLAPEKFNQIMAAFDELEVESSAPVKEKLGAAYSYDEIRAVINYRRKLAAQEIKA